ncbi:MAG: serine hydrolase domain-containing protein [Terracidiphilus sp.]|jgi:CubicO group peptidase (beta-lactamase class C family)
MPIDCLSRRSFLSRGSLATLAVTSAPFFLSAEARADLLLPKPSGSLEQQLDAYIAAYMPAMNAPGMTLGLTDASKTLRTAGYGLANIDQHVPVSTDHLFQIGSISKSFVALVLLQMRDEGKLDLQKPILDYLPDLPITTEFGTITVHHLLTHTSGLPDNDDVFLSDPSARLVQGFKPGEHFHYCNAGFDILGLLAAKLDGKPWRKCVQARIFDPLQMTASKGVITTSSRALQATGYNSFWDDQAYARQGKLVTAPNIIEDNTAGSILSTPADMARYIRMMLNHGQGPNGRIVSEESFTLFSTPFIKADDFSPTASYGYGIAVDTLEGHKILRHTGGMVAFASSIHVDLDGGVAAFASINAMQGYRPTAVTEYAVRLLRADHESKPLPAPPALADPLNVENAADYSGTFTAADGRKLVFAADGKRLSLIVESQPIPLQHAGGGNFISTVPGNWAVHTFMFGRKETAPEPAANAAPNSTRPQPPVVEVTYGSDWFVSSAYAGPHSFTVPADFEAFAGRYRSASPWGGDAFVYILKGQLLLEGEPLVRIGAAQFRPGDESWMPETAEFHHIFQGKAQLLKFAGMDFSRVEVD